MPRGGFDPIKEGATAVAGFDPKTEGATAVGGFDPIKEGAKLVSPAPIAPVVPVEKKGLWLSPDERTGSKMVAVPGSDSPEAQNNRLADVVPQSAMPSLTWIQKNVNDRLDSMATSGRQSVRNFVDEALVSSDISKHPEILESKPYTEGLTDQEKAASLARAENEHPIITGAARAVAGVAGGTVADPRNWPFLASGAARPILQRLISGGFALQMGKGTVDNIKDLRDNWDKLTPEQRSEKITEGGLSALMATASGLHAASGEGHISVDQADVKSVAPEAAKVAEPITVSESEVTPTVKGESTDPIKVGTGTGQPASVDATADATTAVARPIYEMSPDELQSSAAADKAKDKQLVANLFGEEGAKKYQALQRKANSTSDSFDNTNTASDELAKMESSLSPEQQDKLYGIGETGPTHEDYTDFRRALGRVGGDSAQELGDSLKWAITRMGDIKNPSEMKPEEQLAYAQLRHGFELADDNGWDKNVVLQSALKGAVGRFSDPEDAAYMLRQFTKKGDSVPSSNQEPKALTEQKALAAPVEPHVVAPGPGAQNLGTGVDEGRVDLKQIGMSMRAGKKPSVTDRINEAIGPDAIKEKVTNAVSGIVDSTKDAVTQGVERVKATGSAIWDAYKEPEKWTDFKDARGKWDYALQRSSHEAMQFAKDIKAGVPDKLTREAFVNYIQSGGDDAVLEQRSKASSGDLAKGYEAARNLTPTQRIQAENISSWFKQKLEDAQREGMLSAGIENYVNQVWEKPNPVGQKLQADVDYGTLNTNPSLLKKRVFDSYFEGESAGFKPRNKDIGFLVTAYDEAFNKAVAGRAFVKSMLSGNGKDGRPILVANADRASTIKAPDGGVSANLISPKFIGDKFGDYQPVDHPALRKWTWIGKDSDGKPIYQNGDLWVHPEAHGQLKNNLSNSALRQVPMVRTAMDVGQKIKGSMLGYSLFHQVQEGVHAVGHGVNPFRVGKILDFEAPKQKNLIEHGLQVSNARAQSEFMDGHREAYAYRIPGIGRVAQKYGEYLFNDYIPNLKMKTGLDILARNTKRYAGKYTPDQIADISARQANAAYGELNYRQMGRNKTMQDVFRVIALAPDFLEARGRFVAQALRPEGAEQRVALVRLTATLYGVARIGNMALNNGNPRTDKPFAVTYKGKDYFLRSIPGDIAHLVSDPRSFFYTRLNPTTTKPLIEELTGRDEFGRVRSTGQHLWDTLKGWTPIAVQKWIKNPEEFSPLDSLLQGVGVASSKATPSDTRLRKDFTSGALPLQKLQQMQDRGDVSQDQVRKITAPVRKKIVTKGKK